MAKLGEGAKRELGTLRHGLHGEASCQAAVPLRVHQGEALEVPRGKAGGDLAAKRGQGSRCGRAWGGAAAGALVGEGRGKALGWVMGVARSRARTGITGGGGGEDTRERKGCWAQC